MRKLIASFMVFTTVGCASQPDKIATSYISPVQYQSHSCSEISGEMQRVTRRANELHGSLEKLADNDAAQMGVGLALFWPALFFLEGGDGAEAAEYGRLKGERDALEQAGIQKACNLSPVERPQPVQPTEVQKSVI
ncbi:metal ABC transporter ATP-binding protein [Magnetospirillum sp. SS-4]|uniref:metal ABC transporter ATP-binding protein n=1 Tax=Magnetospirillum sp. SS-4 TaxID=2681465 RepID=UPI00157468AE|nr:metal ABC transporter ATP-binding protein [Magnetospirillum sp. SS-4]